MSFDGKANFAIAPVIVAPTPAVSGLTVTVLAGQGSLFTGVPPYNLTVWEPLPPLGQPTKAFAEIVRVEKREGDTFTFSGRAQEGTTAKPIGPGWVIADTITVKALTDIEKAVEEGSTGLASEVTARQAGDSTNATAISNEKTRAEGVEALKATIASLNAETVSRETADNLRLVKAENLKDIGSASTARTNLGLGSSAVEPSSAFDPKGAAGAAEAAASTALATEKGRAETQEGLKLAKIENLKDVSSASTARTNLGLGTAAVEPSTAFDAKGAAASAQTAAEGVTATEKTRAETAEATKASSAALTSETSAREAADATNATAISTEKTRAEGQEVLKAPLASPALTGTPTVPTATAGTSTTQAASTAFASTAKSEAESKGTTALNTEKTAREAGDAEAVKLTGNQTVAGSKTFNSPPIVPTPNAPNDAVSLEYMQGLLEGITPYANVVLATAAALPANAYSAGVLTGVSFGALTIDGTAPVVGQRVLVKNETTEANNGIYTVTHVGAVAELYALTRASDMAAGATVKTGALTYATAGATNANKGFWVVGLGPFTVATNPLKWEQYLGSQDIVAGEGIQITGNTVAVSSSVVRGSATLPLVYEDFTAASVGATPTVTDSGQAVAFQWLETKATVPTIADNGKGHRWVCHPTEDGKVADYFQVQNLAGEMVRAGAEWTMTAVDGGSFGAASICVAMWNGNYNPNLIAPVPISRCHLTLIPGQKKWVYKIFDGTNTAGHNPVVAEGGYGTNPPADGATLWRLDILIDTGNGIAYIFLPDGSIATITNAQIAAAIAGISEWATGNNFATIPASYAMCEHFCNQESVSYAKFPEIATFWADNIIPPYDRRTVSPNSLARVLTGIKSVAYEFTIPGEYLNEKIPAGAISADVEWITCGGPGGSGARQGTGILATGGGPGGTGGVNRFKLSEGQLTGGAYTVVIPTAGAGGAAVEADTTNGNPGTPSGTLSWFTTPTGKPLLLLKGFPGGAGQGGAAVGAGGGGAAGNGLFGKAGTNSSATGLVGPTPSANFDGGPGLAGPGGGITTGNAASNGGPGSIAAAWNNNTPKLGGIVGGAAPEAGAAAQPGRPGDGGGGGASSVESVAQAGADGVGYGAPGGGGGASRNGHNSGKGGKGGPAYLRVTFHFA